MIRQRAQEWVELKSVQGTMAYYSSVFVTYGVVKGGFASSLSLEESGACIPDNLQHIDFRNVISNILGMK